MDQRNAGKSRGKVTAADGWHAYGADHLALMDHLGFRRFHVMGGCIGGGFCLKACEMAPDRITAAVLQNPIGMHENRATWDDAARGFAKKMLAEDPTLTEDVSVDDRKPVLRLGPPRPRFFLVTARINRAPTSRRSCQSGD